jgi:hypothetical protein
LNWGDYLWIPIVVGVFVIVLTAAVAMKRAIVWSFKKVTGKDKVEATQREEIRRKYEDPDWAFYEQHLGRTVPDSMKTVWESAILLNDPVVRLDEEEYLLYPIHLGGLAVDGFYPLGQNELGAAIFLDHRAPEGANAVFMFVRRDERELIHDDAQDFFERISEQNNMLP